MEEEVLDASSIRFQKMTVFTQDLIHQLSKILCIVCFRALHRIDYIQPSHCKESGSSHSQNSSCSPKFHIRRSYPVSWQHKLNLVGRDRRIYGNQTRCLVCFKKVTLKIDDRLNSGSTHLIMQSSTRIVNRGPFDSSQSES